MFKKFVDWAIDIFGSKEVDALRQQLDMYRAKAAEAKRRFDENVKLEEAAREREVQHKAELAAKDSVIRAKEERIASMAEAVTHTERLQAENRKYLADVEQISERLQVLQMENRAFKTECQRLDVLNHELDQTITDLQENLSRTKADASKLEGALAEIARIARDNENGASVVTDVSQENS